MSWYDTIKQSAKDQGCKVDDLIALAPRNDPFYTGRPGEVMGARWFGDQWARFGWGEGVHLRRIHYFLMSREDVFKPDKRLSVKQAEAYDGPGDLFEVDGITYAREPYLNTESDWQYLNNCAKWARYLDIVPAEAFVDRRNKDPIEEHASWILESDWSYEEPTPAYKADAGSWNWNKLPDIPDLPGLQSMPSDPWFNISGYTRQQGYHIEVWCEKTTMDDVLSPLCSETGVNLVRGAGELSITMVLDFLERARKAERPARILYISDYDVAGVGMPISVARKIEFYQRTDYRYQDLDIRLQPIALTKEQVAHYDLPRKPGKDTDARVANFEMYHGEGVVELDALEALMPGELEQLARAAIYDYFDPDLEDGLVKAENDLENALEDRCGDVHGEDIGDVMYDGLVTAYADLKKRWEKTQAEYAELTEPFQEEVEKYREEMESISAWGAAIYREMVRRMDDETDIDPELEFPCPEPDLPYESDVQLYNSERNYSDQLAAYKRYRYGTN